MTHIRRNLTSAEARAHLKTALWERHGERLSDVDHTWVTLYAQGLVSATREGFFTLTDAELPKYLSILADELHNTIAEGE